MRVIHVAGSLLIFQRRITPTDTDLPNRHLLHAPVFVGVADDGKWAIEIKASFEAVWWTIYSQRYMPR